jgi:hypothetical protein
MATPLRIIYQLKITLLETKPLVWRQFQVESRMALDQLHEVIQTVMGWESCYLHEYQLDKKRFGIPDDEFPDDNTLNEQNYVISDLLKQEKTSLTYVYDFGDHWQHQLTLEKILPYTSECTLPYCLDGANACPPEGVGGTFAYADFIAAINDPSHESHEDFIQWIGDDFSPTRFDLSTINDRLG